VGPRLLQVYCCPLVSCWRTECPAAASAGLTYAPTENRALVVPPGAPTVERAGPAGAAGMASGHNGVCRRLHSAEHVLERSRRVLVGVAAAPVG